jgi:hypothetical protein
MVEEAPDILLEHYDNFQDRRTYRARILAAIGEQVEKRLRADFPEDLN